MEWFLRACRMLLVDGEAAEARGGGRATREGLRV
jgi:hypothetical protein